MRVWDGGGGFKEVLVNDPQIKSVIWCQQSLNVWIKSLILGIRTQLFQQEHKLAADSGGSGASALLTLTSEKTRHI